MAKLYDSRVDENFLPAELLKFQIAALCLNSDTQESEDSRLVANSYRIV